MPDIGEKVLIVCECRTADGTLVEEVSLPQKSVVKIGASTLLPRCEQVLAGMLVGQTQDFELAAEQAFGAYDPNLVVEVPRANLGNVAGLEKGATIRLTTQMGQIDAKVVEENEQTVVIDCNHPLAGEAISCHIELHAIVRDDIFDRERHPVGCGCGCEEVKKALAC